MLPKGACQAGGNHHLINMTEYGTAGLFISCFLHAPSSTTTCHPPLTIDDLALVYQPTAAGIAELGQNDPEVCGYNFLPYVTMEALQAKFGGVVREWPCDLIRFARAHVPTYQAHAWLMSMHAPCAAITRALTATTTASVPHAQVASSFEIEWAERSYATRAAPGYDYDDVKKSTWPLKPVPQYEPMSF